jgi:hypothetical protein
VALSLIYGLFLIAFFGNSLVWFNIIPPHFTVASEIFIYLLLILSLIYSSKRYGDYHVHLLLLFGLFLIVAFCSMLVNKKFDLGLVLSLRVMLRFYIFYLALINLPLNNEKLKRINKLLFILFMLQLPACAIKFYFHGGVSEWNTGTYNMVPDGKTTMMIPLVAIGYLAGYYVFYKARAVYILLAIGFVLFGIVSAKAAHLFLMPVTFLGLYYLIYIKGKSVNVARHLSMIAIVLLLSIVVGGTIIKFDRRLNPEREVGGRIDLSHAMKGAQKYTTSTGFHRSEFACGRFATTKLTLHEIWKQGLPRIFFGFGPGCLTSSILRVSADPDPAVSRIRGSYGITGMTYVWTEYGLFGVFVFGSMFCIFARMCWKWYNYEKEPYWKAFALGSVVFAFLNMFCFFAYSTVPISGDTIPPVFFYAMATMYLRLKEITRENVNRPSILDGSVQSKIIT